MTLGEPPDGRARISLIVVNYNSAALTQALVGQSIGGADEVVVVDNASPAGPPMDLRSIRPDVVLIESDTNVGYGAGANRGAARSTGDVLVIANPDVAIGPDGLRALAAEALRPDVGVVAPRFLSPDGSLQRSVHRRDPRLLTTVHELCRPFAAVMLRLAPDWHATLLPSADHEVSRDAHHLLGALIAVRASTFHAVGGFDERFFLYREETDLCRRIRLRGWRNRHLASVTAVHIGGASTADDSIMSSRPVALESHYGFIAKHWGPVVGRVAWFVGLVSSALWVLTGGERAAGVRALRWHLGHVR